MALNRLHLLFDVICLLHNIQCTFSVFLFALPIRKKFCLIRVVRNLKHDSGAAVKSNYHWCIAIATPTLFITQQMYTCTF